MEKLNQKSDYLVILVGTHNRLEQLKVTLSAIQAQTKCSHEIIVIDGGSTDGTIEYLQSRNDITAVFQGKLLGAPRAYNEVWRQIDSQYTCWLSDDTEVTNSGLDLAVRILESDPDIGMVGLKTKDVLGPWVELPYIGGLSRYGILNCNHGVLSTKLLSKVGYFNEAYKMYLIDPDLTASVLCTGKKVVMTKPICVLHHRKWAETDLEAKRQDRTKGVDHATIYKNKFAFLQKYSLSTKIRSRIVFLLNFLLLNKLLMKLFRLNSRDWLNVSMGRFISPLDPVINKEKPYHNVQRIPSSVLEQDHNPYCRLLQENI